MDRNHAEELLTAIQNADRAGAQGIIEDWAAARSFVRVVPELLSPVLETFGDLWAGGHGRVSLATGYVAAKVAEDVFSRILQESARLGQAEPRKGPVVLGNVEDDFHPLGRRMVAAFLATQGWEVHDLGVDVSAPQFVDAAEACGARVIGASAMMYTTAMNVARIREELNRRGLEGRIQLAVGGAVFKLRPELVKDFGADGTTPSAVGASALFDDLWTRATSLDPAREGGRP